MRTNPWKGGLWASVVVLNFGKCEAVTRPEALDILGKINIANIDDIRGHVNLPKSAGDVDISWTSSNPDIVSDQPNGKIAPGVVRRPPPQSPPVEVTLTACASTTDGGAFRGFHLTVQPSVELAETSRYGMANFARSNSHQGQQIYTASSVGNDATTWIAVNNGRAVLNSTKGMHAVRDPSIVRSPEGDKFFLVATDLNVDGVDYGWINWDWAQTNASRYIEVWESTDLRTWSEQRHVLVAPATAGMTFAPEAVWDPQIGAYVVYWTSSVYPEGTYYTPNATDPNRRYPLTRNQILYSTTRDFVHFTPAEIMSGRPGHGALDAVIIRDETDGMYHRIVADRISTGNATQYVPCGGEDIYQERARSILAPADEWELVAGCITHDTMNTTYAEAPLIVQANPGDPRGKGYYMYADQKWPESPAGQPLEEQLNPYWTDDLSSGKWAPIDWTRKPEYDYAQGVLRHGCIVALTTAEHAAWRGADLVSLRITEGPSKTRYRLGEPLDADGLVLEASYTDGVVDKDITEGHGGYTLEGFDSETPGTKTVAVSYTVVDVTKTASFEVKIKRKCSP